LPLGEFLKRLYLHKIINRHLEVAMRKMRNLVGEAKVHLIVQKDTCVFPNLESISIPTNLIFHDWAPKLRFLVDFDFKF
ncbi:MAG: hypothetical protein JW841_14965, partial [Deltaproteobacteria bacterium]|nr:hypothetical protein [Deltaproteobacteria bacterium]